MGPTLRRCPEDIVALCLSPNLHPLFEAYSATPPHSLRVRQLHLKSLVKKPRREYKKAELGTSLADINHRRRSGGQRFLLPIAVTRADLKPIVEEQGFYLLGKDIAQGYA